MSTDALSKARDPLIGTRIDGRYLVQGVLGRGGMGVVYEGIHEQLGRPVAIKVLAAAISGDPVSVQRFLREAQTASQLTHGNIVDVSDLGVLEDGRPYLVMARIQGTDLATLLERHGPQTPRRTVELLSGAAAALDLIHAKGFVHRDVKPENLMHVVREDGSETTLLLDFGIVGLVSAQAARLTAEGSVFGTPAYLPPEVIQGALPDRRADVYALATVAFELLTGRPPFEADNPLRVLPMKIMNDPPRLGGVCKIPFTREIEDVIDRGLTREPDPRWPSAGEFIAALDAAVLSQEEMMGAAADPRTRVAKRRSATGARTQPRGVDLQAPPLRVPPPRGPIDPKELEEERQLRVSLDSQQLEAVLEKSIAPPPVRTKDATTEMIPQQPSGSGTLSIELEAAVLAPMRTRRHFVGIGIAAGVLIAALALVGYLALQGDERPHSPPVGTVTQPTAAPAKPPAPPPAPAVQPATPEPEPVAQPEPAAKAPPPTAATEPTEPEEPAPTAAPEKATAKAAKQRAASKAEAASKAKATKPDPAAVPAPVLTLTPAPKPAGKPGVSSSELVQAAARELIQGHLNAAADLYSQAARIDPKNEAAFRGLGLANERLGRKTEAIRAFNRALTLAPNGQNAAMLRARLAKLQGSP